MSEIEDKLTKKLITSSEETLELVKTVVQRMEEIKDEIDGDLEALQKSIEDKLQVILAAQDTLSRNQQKIYDEVSGTEKKEEETEEGG